MTTLVTDRLDPAAEARIREACPLSRLHKKGLSEEFYPHGGLWDACTCPIQRAAIRADREAREKCWTCGGSPNPSGLVCACGDTGSHSQEVQHLREQALEKQDADTHADALAQVHRELAAAPCMGELLGEDCGWCPSCRSKAAVAKHDARRRSK